MPTSADPARSRLLTLGPAPPPPPSPPPPSPPPPSPQPPPTAPDTRPSTSFGPTRRPSSPTAVAGERVGWPTASPGTPAARLRLAPGPNTTGWSAPTRGDGPAEWGRWGTGDDDRDADRRAARAPATDRSWDDDRDDDRAARWDGWEDRRDGRSDEQWDGEQDAWWRADRDDRGPRDDEIAWDDRDLRATPTSSGPGAWSGASLAASAPYTWRERLAERWLPAGWVRARWDPGRAGALALAVVAALAAVVAAVGVWSGRPTAEPVPALPVVDGAPTSRPSAAASPVPGTLLVVSVAGRVEKPGLVRVPDGARVGEAVAAAGGVLAGTDTTALNLAAKVSDGEQILVGVAPPPVAAGGSAGTGSAATGGGGSGAAGAAATGTGAAGAAAPGGKVSLNAATLEQLDGLPGVGPVTAKKILDWRTQNGRFTAIEQLREISGIGEARFGTLKDQVTL